MAKKAKEKSTSIFDDIDEQIEDKVQVKPENAVNLLAEEGSLPVDWCPYGVDYMPERAKFIGDEEPFTRQEGKAKEWEVINDGDNDLSPIYFTLPTPPKLELIDGYGLDNDDQYFRRLEIPKKLKLLEKKALDSLFEIERRNRQDTVQGYKLYLRYWEMFEAEYDNLTEEINWLKKIWWCRTYGYWCYIDGEPTFIPPDYFDFLNFYYISEAECYPEYRDDVRRKFCFSWYLESCTETFANIDVETGEAVKNADGRYEMIDLGRRVFFGDVEPKTRRTGATHEAIHKILKGSTTRRSHFSSIISFEGNNAEIHYKKKLLPAFDNLLMCIKPMWEGSRRPSTLRLDAPPNVYHIKGLGSAVMFSDSGGLFKNEGDRLNGLLNDEQGKCFRLDTEILMSNGDVRKVQDIKEGDMVMGDDGTPRHVSGITRGYGNLYEIANKFGSFVCNADHVLSLRSSTKSMVGCKKAGDIINHPLKEVLSWSDEKRRNLKIYRKPIIYEGRNVTLDPYFLGLWLGDGSHSDAQVTNVDDEIINYLKEYARLWGGKLVTTNEKSHRISFHSRFKGNPIKTTLKRMNLLYNKHIPSNYLRNTEDVRLQLLAGIIDTDGGRDPKKDHLTYEVVQKRQKLAEQICQLANSLGFWSRIENKVATMKRKDGTVYRCDVFRVKIYGDLYKIPVRVKHKQYIEPTGFRNKNSNVSWFEINPCGQGDYYGFAVDGNHLFMLANQIVVHNSSQLNVNIFERWNINKFTMSTGMGINILDGVYVKNPSTVEQMESTSAPYYRMCMMSDFYKRIPHKGQTVSGFARIFLPAYLRMEGFIDRFGKSVVNEPTERQRRLSPTAIFAVTNKGIKQMLQAERDALIAENTPQSLETYRSIRRKSPFTWSECWLGASGNVGYNLEIVDKRLGELNRLKSFGKSPCKIGYFYRENGNPDGKVLWKNDMDIPKFKMSMDIPDQMTNQREMIEMWDGLSMKIVQSWRPLNGQRFTCGVDPFRNLRANEAKLSNRLGTSMSSSRQSDGGIAILWEYDESLDRGKPRKDWQSGKCILTYRYRPTTQEEFFEDVIMACQYFGAVCYPEQNVESFIAHVLKRGYGGYFLYDIGLDGKQKPLPGRYTGTEVQQEIVREYKDYIAFRGHVENHDDLLTEIKNFSGLEDFTNKDLKVAFGFALLGSKSRYREFLSGSSSDAVDFSGYSLFTKRRY